MATSWDITGSSYLISGTLADVTGVKGYSQNSYFLSGNNMGQYRSTNYGAQVIRIEVTPTVKVKSVTISFAHTDNTGGYTSGAPNYHAKISTSADAWPSYSDTSGDLNFALTSAGTKKLEMTLATKTSSKFYIFLWSNSDSTYYQHIVHVNSLSGLSCAKAAPAIYIKTGASTWSAADTVYVKTGASTWTEVDNLYIKTGASTWSEST